MTTEPMSEVHQAAGTPWSWPVAAARRLPAAPQARWLAVREGRVWLTRSCGQPGVTDDVWLSAGQQQWLPAGSEWVLEGWPAAQLELLQTPPAAPTQRDTSWISQAWRAAHAMLPGRAPACA